MIQQIQQCIKDKRGITTLVVIIAMMFLFSMFGISILFASSVFSHSVLNTADKQQAYLGAKSFANYLGDELEKKNGALGKMIYQEFDASGLIGNSYGSPQERSGFFNQWQAKETKDMPVSIPDQLDLRCDDITVALTKQSVVSGNSTDPDDWELAVKVTCSVHNQKYVIANRYSHKSCLLMSENIMETETGETITEYQYSYGNWKRETILQESVKDETDTE